MSQSPTTSAATPDVTQDAEPTVVKNGMSHAPVLITPQEVMFSTAAQRSSYLGLPWMAREMNRS